MTTVVNLIVNPQQIRVPKSNQLVNLGLNKK
eukprot:UN06010